MWTPARCCGRRGPPRCCPGTGEAPPSTWTPSRISWCGWGAWPTTTPGCGTWSSTRCSSGRTAGRCCTRPSGWDSGRAARTAVRAGSVVPEPARRAKRAVRSGGVDLQPLGPRRVTQLVQGHLLDLADALAGQAELAADLVERALAAVVQAEAEPDDGLLALREGGQHDLHLVAQQAVGDLVGRLLAGIDAGHEVAERALPVLAHRLV